MTHVFYVAAAYGVTALVLAGVGLWLYLDYRGRGHELAELEARGVRRRSQGAGAAE